MTTTKKRTGSSRAANRSTGARGSQKSTAGNKIKSAVAGAKKLYAAGKLVAAGVATARAAMAKSKPQAAPDLLPALKAYVRANADQLLSRPNVTSVGIGYKQSDGKATPQLAIQFTVASKFSPQTLDEKGIAKLPSSIRVGEYDVPTDVIERRFKPGYIIHQSVSKDARKSRLDPVQPGVSISGEKLPQSGAAGTLGTFVLDRKTNLPVLLSNWHVLVGADGDVGDRVTQPGHYDDSQIEQNTIGKVLRHFLGPAGDCAIASVSGRTFKNEQLEMPGISVSRIGSPELGDRVAKSGRTTAVTYGVVTRVEVNTTLTYLGGVSATIGGFEIGPDPQKPAQDGEISRGGDSGSAWMAVDSKGQPTDIILGLHFAGQDGATEEVALACYAKSVMTKLDVEPLGKFSAQAVSATATHLQTGFDRDFLPFPVDVQSFDDEVNTDLAKLEGRTELRYCHFSVWLSKKRKYPVCVAWNIDGSRYRKLNRVNFRADRRGDLENYQLSNDFYVDNPLDRGHIARRADLCWGAPEEAKQANYDSFYYTNIAPQHEAFNQSENYDYERDGGLWGRLENAVFDSEQPHQLRVSVMGGPVFGSGDRRYEQGEQSTRLPREFWKIVAYRDDADDHEKVFAFLLTQAKMIKDFLGPQTLNLEDWLWARIDLSDLQAKTGVRFSNAMHRREVKLNVPQALGNGPKLRVCRSSADFFSS